MVASSPGRKLGLAQRLPDVDSRILLHDLIEPTPTRHPQQVVLTPLREQSRQGELRQDCDGDRGGNGGHTRQNRLKK